MPRAGWPDSEGLASADWTSLLWFWLDVFKHIQVLFLLATVCYAMVVNRGFSSKSRQCRSPFPGVDFTSVCGRDSSLSACLLWWNQRNPFPCWPLIWSPQTADARGLCSFNGKQEGRQFRTQHDSAIGVGSSFGNLTPSSLF